MAQPGSDATTSGASSGSSGTDLLAAGGPAIESAHAREIAEVTEQLGTGLDGLSESEAATRLERYGPNKLPEGKKESALVRLLRQFNDPMIYVLIGAAVLTAILGEVIDTIVIAAVVLINAIIGYVQEGKAADALEGIRNMLSLHAQVRRDGSWHTIDADDLVPGDVVRLSSGDKVPADIRLTRTTNLQIEESALTGESVPAEKDTEAVDADAGVGDRTSMAFSGTTVAAGSAVGVVTGTGSQTEIGHITNMLGEVESLETPLVRQMSQFSKTLSVIVVIMAVVMLVLAWVLYEHQTLPELIMAAISFAVAAIPEGLPAVLTITLALGVQRMAGRNAITRRMNSVETLGSVTVICSDKTGTLTRNEMTVRSVVTLNGRYEVTGTGYAPEGVVTRDGAEIDLAEHPDVVALGRVAAYANDSSVTREGDRWVLAGEPTDGGLRTFGLKVGFDESSDRLAAVPFDSAYKYMATLDDTELPDGTHGRLIHLKGAPDRLLDRCDRQGINRHATDPLDRDFWEHQIDELSSGGLRVLAAAIKLWEPDALERPDVDDGGFIFLGLYGIIDPPREEATTAIRACHEAGIRVKMITGDHAGTASAIGREMGIGIGKEPISGPELERATDEELRVIAQEHDVFARTSPEHKLRLVKALQADGEVVSMTGDGVNDAPSLKRADIGVAMGIKGTEATKDAADVVLADDNFATIERAVEMGRTIYDNLQKAIIFILPTNGAQGLIMLVAVLLGWTLPLTPVQVLWVNTITAVTLSLALAFEPAESDIMSRPPRKPGGSILPAWGLIRIAYVSVLIGAITIAVFVIGIEVLGKDLDVARTVAVNTLVVGQIFYLFASRYSRTTSIRKALFTTNPVSWITVGIMIVLQLLFVYAPFMNVAFTSAPVTLIDWIPPVLAGVGVFLVVEVDKLIIRARNK